MFFDILKPHTHHSVSEVFVHSWIAGTKWKGLRLIFLLEKLREGLLLDWVDLLEGEPTRKGRERHMRRWLNDRCGERETILLKAHVWTLRNEVGLMGIGVRLYMVRMMRLTWKMAWPSLGITLYPPWARLRETTMGGRFGFFLNIQNYTPTNIKPRYLKTTP